MSFGVVRRHRSEAQGASATTCVPLFSEQVAYLSGPNSDNDTQNQASAVPLDKRPRDRDLGVSAHDAVPC
jgi:hypothetical protein